MVGDNPKFTETNERCSGELQKIELVVGLLAVIGYVTRHVPGNDLLQWNSCSVSCNTPLLFIIGACG